MLSYRCDVGVPGYTGVIPASGGVLVPSKDANLRTGKAVDPATATKARDFALFPGQDMESTYVKTLKAVPGATKPRDKTGGGYWIMDVGQGGGHGSETSYWTGTNLEGSNTRPFIAKSTYQGELLRSTAHADAALNRTQDVRPTISHLKAGTQLKNGGLNALEKTTGYVSTYTAMVVKDPKTGGSAAPGRELTMTAPATFDRAKVERKGLRSRFDGETVYGDNFGKYGSDPLSLSVNTADQMTGTATTRTLNLGTTRGGVKQIPGYAGFMQRSGKNPRAIEHSGGLALREDAKSNARMYSAMDQYSRGMVPGYLGYRTRDPNNFKLPQPPSVMTTTGKVNFECHRREHPTVDNANFRNGMDGTMGFFTGGTISVSENGKSNAEKFYHLLRPGEGLPRIHYASKTTSSGYLYPN